VFFWLLLFSFAATWRNKDVCNKTNNAKGRAVHMTVFDNRLIGLW